jgi:hypothetical protein
MTAARTSSARQRAAPCEDAAVPVFFAIIVLFSATLLVLRVKARLGRMRAGDFIKVAIPRTVDRPLAVGTRLDAAHALKKAGVPMAEVRRLSDGAHEQELVDRYWQIKDLPRAKVVND